MNQFDEGSLLFRHLQEQDIPTAVNILSSSFLTLNRAWIKYTISIKETVKQIMKSKVKDSFSVSKSSYVMEYKGKVIGAGICFDLQDYIHNHHGISKVLSSVGEILEKNLISPQKYQRGQAMFGDLGGISAKYAGHKLSAYFYFQMLKDLKEQNYKYYFTRISSEPLKKVLSMFPYCELGSVKIKSEGGEIDFWLLSFNLSALPTEDSMKFKIQPKL